MSDQPAPGFEWMLWRFRGIVEQTHEKAPAVTGAA